MNAHHHIRRHAAVASLAAVALLAALAITACGGASGSTPSGSPQAASPSGSSVAVAIRDYAYSPPTLTIQAGTAVTWTNDDSVVHTVTSADGPSTDASTTDLFDSGAMGKGDTFTHTFDTPGTYDYLCTPHRSMPSMHAIVVVE